MKDGQAKLDRGDRNPAPIAPIQFGLVEISRGLSPGAAGLEPAGNQLRAITQSPPAALSLPQKAVASAGVDQPPTRTR